VTFLIVGGDSAIAGAVLAELGREGLPAITTSRRPGSIGPELPYLDLSRPLDDWRPPDGITAACICAAVANLVDCARDPAGSERVNVIGTIALVERLAASGIPALYLSTDKVFDGSRPQMPADAALSPRSIYGRQKAQADGHFQGMIAAGAPVAILRLARIVPSGWPLLRQWHDNLAAGRAVQPFRDMMTAPTLASDAAAAIIGLLEAHETGVWQLSGARDVSYAEIARFIAERIGAYPNLIEPVTAADAGMPEGATPLHTTLDCHALEQRLGIRSLDPWQVIEATLGLAARSLGAASS
jgi:dTDP-4-dehydrorhamnose reductase